MKFLLLVTTLFIWGEVCSSTKMSISRVPVVISNTKPTSVAQIKSKKSQLKTLAPILAASFCAAAIMYPLDLIRALKMSSAGGPKLTTLQLLSKFRDTHGIQGFFTQGLAPELARSTWMRFIKFGLFPIVHMGITNGIPENKGSPITKAYAAIITSFPEVISILPLEAAKIALQLDSAKLYDNNMIKAMGAVFEQRGFAGFGVGYIGIQIRQAAWSATYFASLPFFEKQVTAGFEKLGIDTEKNALAKTTSQLTSGFLAGVFGALLNTPADTIRTNVQKRVFGNLAGSTTFLGVGQEIIANRGATALYAGFGFKAFHLGGGGALMAFFVPFFKKLFEKL